MALTDHIPEPIPDTRPVGVKRGLQKKFKKYLLQDAAGKYEENQQLNNLVFFVFSQKIFLVEHFLAHSESGCPATLDSGVHCLSSSADDTTPASKH